MGLQEQSRELIGRSPLGDLVGRDLLGQSAEQVVTMIRERGLMITTAESRAEGSG